LVDRGEATFDPLGERRKNGTWTGDDGSHVDSCTEVGDRWYLTRLD
jgi:hypothetical protein